MIFKLMMAGCWLVVAAAMFCWPLLDGQAQLFPITGTRSTGIMVALIFGLFNLGRWWSLRAQASYRRAAEEADLRRWRAHHAHSDPEQEPDPNFIFTDP